MNFRKSTIALAAAGALATGTLAVPTTANATPAWVVPAIVAAGVGGLVLGAGHAHAYDYRGYYGPPPRGVVDVRPAERCWIEHRRRGPVEVCAR